MPTSRSGCGCAPPRTTTPKIEKCPQKPVCGDYKAPRSYDISITQGVSFLLNWCSSTGEYWSIRCATPGVNGVLKVSEPTCVEPGAKIYIFCDNDAECEAWSINGIHEVLSVSADRLEITVDTRFSFPSVRTFVNQGVVISGCQPKVIDPPKYMILNDLSDCTFEGCITNRYATQRTNIALKTDVAQGSNIIKVSPKGQLIAGDRVDVPGTNILDAEVLQVWHEAGYDYVKIDQLSNITETCCPLSSRVGVLARFRFDLTNAACGCITAYIVSETVTVDNVEYRGTADLPLIGEYIKGECQQAYKMGYYSISCVKATDYSAADYQHVMSGAVYLFPTTIPVCNQTAPVAADLCA